MVADMSANVARMLILSSLLDKSENELGLNMESNVYSLIRLKEVGNIRLTFVFNNITYCTCKFM